MENLDDVGAKLDVLIRLIAIHVVGDRTGADAIGVLASAGLSNELIAELVGTTPATVRAARSRASRKGGSKA